VGYRARRAALVAVVATFALVTGISVASATSSRGPITSLHYAPNANFGTGRHADTYEPGKDGFNLADVSSVGALDLLPAHVLGLVYLGLCSGADSTFVATVTPFIGNPKLYGFYLVDEPDPTGQFGRLCLATSLKAEADWIHAKIPGAITFIVLMNLGTPTNPSYVNTYNSANTDIDLFGLDPYPCRKELRGCDYSVINAAVMAAEASGLRQSQIVPVYQAFGGGGYRSWSLPTPAQEETILSTWATLVPRPAFDFAYSWGRQDRDSALVDTKALQRVFGAHNGY